MCPCACMHMCMWMWMHECVNMHGCLHVCVDAHVCAHLHHTLTGAGQSTASCRSQALAATDLRGGENPEVRGRQREGQRGQDAVQPSVAVRGETGMCSLKPHDAGAAVSVSPVPAPHSRGSSSLRREWSACSCPLLLEPSGTLHPALTNMKYVSRARKLHSASLS